MLLVQFSIAVQQEYGEDLMGKLDYYGIQPITIGKYDHVLWDDEYLKIKCVSPIDRLKMLCDDLDNSMNIGYQATLLFD